MLIVALDVFTFDEMKYIVDSTKAEVDTYKVGLQLLTYEGPKVIRYLKNLGKEVFLDLKLYESSNSIASAIRSAGNHGVDIVTVHASGGQKMMEAAVKAAEEFPTMEVLALTILAGLSDQDMMDVGFNRSSEDQVLKLASLAERSGCHGVVASPREAANLRHLLDKKLLICTPRISSSDSNLLDQQRLGTLADAINSGASCIIVGRQIVQAENPEEAAREMNRQILATTESRWLGLP